MFFLVLFGIIPRPLAPAAVGLVFASIWLFLGCTLSNETDVENSVVKFILGRGFVALFAFWILGTVGLYAFVAEFRPIHPTSDNE